MRDRVALTNHFRGILTEYGIIMSKSLPAFRKQAGSALAELEKQQEVSAAIVSQLKDDLEEVDKFNERLKQIEREIAALAGQDKNYTHFLSAPGVGKITAVKMTVLLTEPGVFKNGRQFAAFLGLTPMSFRSGGHNVVTHIPKFRCDAKTRALMVQCAHAASKTKVQSNWTRDILKRKPKAVAVMAIANRLARQLWAMATKNEDWRMFVPLSAS